MKDHLGYCISLFGQVDVSLEYLTQSLGILDYFLALGRRTGTGGQGVAAAEVSKGGMAREDAGRGEGLVLVG